LDRITGVSGKVREQKLSQLQSLDAGKWFGAEFLGQKNSHIRGSAKYSQKY
jgi:hypothetical protein